MQDQPNQQELILAVREFLEAEILPTLGDPRLKFRTLVAINALGMVARESELGSVALWEECHALEQLLGFGHLARDGFDRLEARVITLQKILAGRIRSHDIPAGSFAHLEQAARAKLRISSPAYLERYAD